jgi:hypothetical protein
VDVGMHERSCLVVQFYHSYTSHSRYPHELHRLRTQTRHNYRIMGNPRCQYLTRNCILYSLNL